MALPHSPGRQSDLSSMAESDNSSRTRCLSHKSSGSSFLSKLVAGKHPFSKSARSRRDSVEVEVPPRTTSLATEESNPARISSTATDTTAGHAIASTNSSVSHLEQPSEPAANPNPNPDPDVTRHVALEPTPLERQRQELVDRVVEEARRNKKAPLDEVGRSRFEQAGFGHLIDKKSDVEVDTRWLKPVVHETIIRKIHTEYQTVIDREIHIHHVYPKIQPIHDPDPIMLQPRHRMFSPRTGHWHEVIGDAEAISLLGEDAFLNGPKQYREIRRAALPGLDSSYEDQPDEIKAMYTGKARVIERETVEGGPTGHWRTIMGESSNKEGLADEVHLIDGLEGLGEGVRTMHVSI